MTPSEIIFSILGSLLYLTGFLPYIYHAFHGRVIPHAFSWTVWAILSGINTLAFIDGGGFTGVILTPIIRTFALIIGAVVGWMVIKKIQITLFDYICIVLAVACIGIVYYHGVSQAIIPTILVDMLVLAPTLRKIWDDPDSEDALTWLLVVFSQACILLSLPVHTLSNSLFWAYAMIINALVAFLIYRRRLTVHSWRYRIQKWIPAIFSRE